MPDGKTPGPWPSSKPSWIRYQPASAAGNSFQWPPPPPRWRLHRPEGAANRPKQQRAHPATSRIRPQAATTRRVSSLVLNTLSAAVGTTMTIADGSYRGTGSPSPVLPPASPDPGPPAGKEPPRPQKVHPVGPDRRRRPRIRLKLREERLHGYDHSTVRVEQRIGTCRVGSLRQPTGFRQHEAHQVPARIAGLKHGREASRHHLRPANIRLLVQSTARFRSRSCPRPRTTRPASGRSTPPTAAASTWGAIVYRRSTLRRRIMPSSADPSTWKRLLSLEYAGVERRREGLHVVDG